METTRGLSFRDSLIFVRAQQFYYWMILMIKNKEYFILKNHMWALTPISVISYIGLSLILELPISD
jgi:hypothetical protein